MKRDGYRWWYIDATCDDGQHGLTIIGFVGSVFSPYYKRARARGHADPANHCAINVALYGGQRRWAMTERGASSVSRSGTHFRVGPSAMRWNGDTLTIEIDEHCAPLPLALRGRVELQAGPMNPHAIALDAEGQHFWRAVAPQARVAVTLDAPRLSWKGAAYHDMNWGEEPLEQGFRHWTWLRANMQGGTRVLYDVTRRDGSHFQFGRDFTRDGMQEAKVPAAHALRRGFWGMGREVLSERMPVLVSTLEDAPFYTRNHVRITLDGAECEAYHESLSLDRFVHPVVQRMLPFRMPRWS